MYHIFTFPVKNPVNDWNISVHYFLIFLILFGAHAVQRIGLCGAAGGISSKNIKQKNVFVSGATFLVIELDNVIPDQDSFLDSLNIMHSVCFYSFGCRITLESRPWALVWKRSDLNFSSTPYKLYNMEYMFLLGLSEKKMKSEH